MKTKIKTIILAAMLLITVTILSGCMSSCFYKDGEVIKKFDEPYENGLASYYAGLNNRKGTARLRGASYIVDSTSNGEIFIKLPQIVESDSGEKYEIKEFGGPTGTHAPLEYFEIGINVKNGSSPSEEISLTVDAGALPLDTHNFADYVEVVFEETGEKIEIPLYKVKFLTNGPIEYYVCLDDYRKFDSKWIDDDTEIESLFYNVPNSTYIGGNEIAVQVKHPNDGYERKLFVGPREIEPYAIHKDYIEYRFTMPYEDLILDIEDWKITNEP